jgi:predicted GIY-YIG superfamily endonuclease
MNRVRYWYDEGRFEAFETALRRAVGQYARHYEYIYLGLTQRRPEERFAEHQAKWARGHKWDQMIVVFHGKTYADMCKAEQGLIDYAKEKARDYHCRVENDIDHRRPRLVEDYNGFWVYILLQKEYLKGGV